MECFCLPLTSTFWYCGLGDGTHPVCKKLALVIPKSSKSREFYFRASSKHENEIRPEKKAVQMTVVCVSRTG